MGATGETFTAGCSLFDQSIQRSRHPRAPPLRRHGVERDRQLHVEDGHRPGHGPLAVERREGHDHAIAAHDANRETVGRLRSDSSLEWGPEFEVAWMDNAASVTACCDEELPHRMPAGHEPA